MPNEGRKGPRLKTNTSDAHLMNWSCSFMHYFFKILTSFFKGTLAMSIWGLKKFKWKKITCLKIKGWIFSPENKSFWSWSHFWKVKILLIEQGGTVTSSGSSETLTCTKQFLPKSSPCFCAFHCILVFGEWFEHYSWLRC